MKRILFVMLVAGLLLPSIARAQSSKRVIINEIMWMGSSASSFDEWIELRNLTAEDIDISGWVIAGAGGEENKIILPRGSRLEGNGFFVISNYNSSSSLTVLTEEPDLVLSSLSLKNEDSQITLRDDKDYEEDIAGTSLGTYLAGNKENKWSMERRDNPDDGTKSIDWYTATASKGFKEGVSDIGTPGYSNSPDLSRKAISIKEAKASIREVTINGVIVAEPNRLFDKRAYIIDNASGIRIFLEDGLWPSLLLGQEITVRGRIQSYYSETELKITDDSEIEMGSGIVNFKPIVSKIKNLEENEGAFIEISGRISQTLGDTFYIEDETGTFKVYVKEGLLINIPEKKVGDRATVRGIINSWNGDLRLLPIRTEDIQIFKKESVKKTLNISIGEARLQTKGTTVRVRGVVSVRPGILGKTYFYIQDKDAGIQIYSWYKDFPEIFIGDLIEVLGEISESGAEIRIKVSSKIDITIIEKNQIPIAKKIKVSMARLFKGMLVKIRGAVVKTFGDTFYINDGSGTVKVFIKRETGIKKPRLNKEDIIEITGIVSETKTGLRIMPRYQGDFSLVWTKPKKGKVLKAASTRKVQLSKPHIILEGKKESSQNYYLFYFSITAAITSSIILLKNVRLER